VAHLHKQIRDAMVAALTGLPTTGAHVWANRYYPLNAAELPAIRIYVDEEDVVQAGMMGQFRQRDLAVSVEACAKTNTTLDDTLDQSGLEIEQALASGITVGGRVLYPVYTGATFQFDDSIDLPVGVKRHRFRLVFAAASNSPDSL